MKYSGKTIHEFSIEDLSLIALMLKEQYIKPKDLKRMIDDGGYCYKKWMEVWQKEMVKQFDRMWI